MHSKDEYKKHVSFTLKKLKTKKNLTVEEIGKDFDVKKSGASELLNGKHSAYAHKVFWMCEKYNFSPYEFMIDDPNEPDDIWKYRLCVGLNKEILDEQEKQRIILIRQVLDSEKGEIFSEFLNYAYIMYKFAARQSSKVLYEHIKDMTNAYVVSLFDDGGDGTKPGGLKLYKTKKTA